MRTEADFWTHGSDLERLFRARQIVYLICNDDSPESDAQLRQLASAVEHPAPPASGTLLVLVTRLGRADGATERTNGEVPPTTQLAPPVRLFYRSASEAENLEVAPSSARGTGS